jgi:dynein light chain LC8-type
MSESFEQDAISIALVAVDKFRQLKDIAFHIKHEYDRKYPGSGKATEGVYHCIVGKSYASGCRGFGEEGGRGLCNLPFCAYGTCA